MSLQANKRWDAEQGLWVDDCCNLRPDPFGLEAEFVGFWVFWV